MSPSKGCTFVTLVVVSSMVLASAWGQSLVIQTADGPISGVSTTSTWTNTIMYTFLGVPFAAPPVGDLRFRLPVAPAKWTSTLNCTEMKHGCMQTNSGQFPGFSEDCLYLNVYSPDLAPKDGLAPVYFLMHGGGFVGGSAASYNPDQFVAQGIVVVTVNYRLGVFGFLNLGTSSAPGNMGSFDNIMAMKWVQREISKFGGDPTRVTIGGNSAGSMMSHLHYLSPASKGLFHQVLADSGASLMFAVSEYPADYAATLANITNCTFADVTATEQCLRNLTADDLLVAENADGATLNEGIMGNMVSWTPTVDKNTNVDNPFLPEMPIKLMENKTGSSVPFLMGANRDEGTLKLLYSVVTDAFMKTYATNMKYLMPLDELYYNSPYDVDKKIQAIKDLYFNGQDPSMATIKGYIDLYTDVVFAYPTAASARYFRQRDNVYMYLFEFHGSVSPGPTKLVEDRYNLSLVGHGDEIYYLVCRDDSMISGTKEKLTLQRMVTFWSNFIKFGNPTPSPDPLLQNVTWTPQTPVSGSFAGYLRISDDLTMVQEDYKLEAVKLWDSVYNIQAPTPSAASRLQAYMFLIVLVATTFCQIHL